MCSSFQSDLACEDTAPVSYITMLQRTATNSTQQRITDAGVWHLQVRIIIIHYHKQTIGAYHFMTSSDRFPVPVWSALKSNLTIWWCQNLPKRAVNGLTVQVSTTELGKMFQIFTMHTHTRLTALCPGLSRWAGTKKVKPIWAICKSAHRSRKITTPAPHHSSFLQAGCPSCRPTNSVKALKESNIYNASREKMLL